LQRVAQPATLAGRVTGFEPYGVVPADGRGVIRIYGTGLTPGSHCAALLLALALPDCDTCLPGCARRAAGGPGESSNPASRRP
jgi:hypothetical protein